MATPQSFRSAFNGFNQVAKMAIFTRQVCPDAAPAPQRIQDKHYLRKHGPNAYYGQK